MNRFYWITGSIVGLFCIPMQANGFESTDLIECKREKPDTRQFCYIRDNSYDIGITLPKNTKFNSMTFNISEVVQQGAISLDLENDESGTFYLSALEPIVKYEIDWSRNLECARNGLWNHNIYSGVKPVSGEMLILSRINTGLNRYEHNLENISTQSVAPWSINETDKNLSVSAKFMVVDSDYSASQPLPQERIPSSCKMLIQNLRLTYDPKLVSKDLSNLRITTLDKIRMLVQGSVLHANMIDSTRGAQCSAYSLGKTLRQSELLGESDSWESLSPTSKEAVKTALIKAKSLGAFTDIDAENILSQFFSQTLQDDLAVTCDPSLLPDYTVSTVPFMKGNTIINQQGWSNAVTFTREKGNLRKLFEGAWALAESSAASLSEGSAGTWLKEVAFYSYVDKDAQ